MKNSTILVLLTLLFFTATAALAGEVISDDDTSPFAEHKLLLQISDSDPEKRTAILNVASNVLKHYGGSDIVAIEVIAFGSGIDLMLKGHAWQERLTSLADSGVKFIACENTLKGLGNKTHSKPALIPGVSTTPVGVAYILEKVAEGYVLVKP